METKDNIYNSRTKYYNINRAQCTYSKINLRNTLKQIDEGRTNKTEAVKLYDFVRVLC